MSAGYEPVFFDAGWILERHLGWREVFAEPSLKVLSKPYGPLQKYLALSRQPDPRRLAESLARCAARRHCMIIFHDFLAPNGPQALELGGRLFRKCGDQERQVNAATFVVDLSLGLDVLWLNMDKDQARYKCQKAERMGASVQFTKVPSEEELTGFFDSYEEMARERSLDRLNSSVIRAMFSRGDLILGSCRIPGMDEPSSVFIYTMDKRAYYLKGVGRQGNSGAGHLLHWETIKHLKSLGLRWYDLGGVLKTQPPDGIFRFKKSLGGLFLDLGVEYRHLPPELEAPYAIYRRFRRVWAHG